MSDGFTQSASGKWQIDKDPNAVLDYIENWAAWLADISDTINSASAVITSSAGATSAVVDSCTVAGGNAVHVWISGGNAGETLAVRVRITTAGGRTDDRTFYVKIKEK